MDSNTNEYHDEYEDYFTSALQGKNTKTDPGSTQTSKKQRRIPIHKLTEEDEIPEMPEIALEKPNDSHYQKLIKECDDAITKHQKSIDELKDQIDTEKFGNNPERKTLLNNKFKLIEELKPLTEQINILNKELQPFHEDLHKLKDDRDSLLKEITYKDADRLENEIK